MIALRFRQLLAAATVGLLVVQLPATAAAQSCTARECTAVNHVQVTVPERLGLSATGPGALTVANATWRRQGSGGGAASAMVVSGMSVTDAPTPVRTWSRVTEIRDNPRLPLAPQAVRYTLVGS